MSVIKGLTCQPSVCNLAKTMMYFWNLYIMESLDSLS